LKQEIVTLKEELVAVKRSNDGLSQELVVAKQELERMGG
jgi:hypothetical protein